MMKSQLQDEALSKVTKVTESKSTLVEEYEFKIKELNKRHRDDVENTVAKLKKEFEEKLSVVKVEYQDELEFKSNEAAEMQIILKSEIEALKEQMDEDKIAIKQGHVKIYDDKIHEITKRHEEDIKMLKDNFENEKMKYKENENRLHENLKKEIQNMKSKHEEVTQNMSTEMEGFKNLHEEQLQRLKQDHNEEIKAKEKEIEIHEEYEVEMDELKRSHKEALDNLVSKYKAEMEKFSAMESQVTAVDELRAQVSRHQQFEEHLYKENTQLKEALAGAKQGSMDPVEVAELRRQHEAQVAGLKMEPGDKNIALASLKVDVDRGELQYKKKCDILQADLDYEKSVNGRLTQEIRRQQASAMDTTCIGLGQRSAPAAAGAGPGQVGKLPQDVGSTRLANAAAATNTSASADSPVWSSGSGALKEIRLHDAEMKVKSLEKDNLRLKEHEEFYINKAREWKNRALKYERSLQEHGIPVPSRGAKPAEAENTENINLVLTQRPEPRRTEADFRLPEGARKKAGG